MSGLQTTEELLFAYAAGKLDRAIATVLGTHLALSNVNRPLFSRFEAVGGVLLEDIGPVPVSKNCVDSLFARLDDPLCLPDEEPVSPSCEDSDIPQPLAGLIDGRIEGLPWGRFGSVSEIILDARSADYRLSLLRLKAGKAVPRHTHEGQELTVVVRGGFRDGLGHYRRGDLSIADGTIDHQPVADDDEDCYALAVTDAPLRLTGLFGRLLNPFIR